MMLGSACIPCWLTSCPIGSLAVMRDDGVPGHHIPEVFILMWSVFSKH